MRVRVITVGKFGQVLLRAGAGESPAGVHHMKITAIEVSVELTDYTADNKVKPRPQGVKFAAWESEIPPEVDAWIRSRIKLEE